MLSLWLIEPDSVLAQNSGNSGNSGDSGDLGNFGNFGNTRDIAYESIRLSARDYRAIDPEFWKSVLQEIEDRDFEAVAQLSLRQIRESGSNAKGLTVNDSSTQAEGRLALAIAMMGQDLNYSTFVLLSSLLREQLNSEIGEQALSLLSVLVTQKDDPFDPDDLEKLIVSLDFGPLPPLLASFVGFHKAIFNLRYGYKKWARQEQKKILKGSFWDYQWKYFFSLAKVASGKIESAHKELAELNNQSQLPLKIQTQVQRQLARIFFEQKKYVQSDELLDRLILPLREKGRALLERSWAKYYVKDYSTALGLLEVLRAPMFDFSLTPERYLLEMLIYRDLCYYDEVQRAADEFKFRFNGALRAIRGRENLLNNSLLVQMALLDGRYQTLANFIGQLRIEKLEFNRKNYSSLPELKDIYLSYSRKDLEVRQRLEASLLEPVRTVANELLEAEQDISFLEYASKLDALRIVRRDENRRYSSDKISYVIFDKVYWVVDKEFWPDEIDSYKVLITSRCQWSVAQ